MITAPHPSEPPTPRANLMGATTPYAEQPPERLHASAAGDSLELFQVHDSLCCPEQLLDLGPRMSQGWCGGSWCAGIAKTDQRAALDVLGALE